MMKWIESSIITIIFVGLHHKIKFLLNNPVTSEGSYRIRTKEDFELLFKTNYSFLCSYANSFLKDIEMSEDVVQEVMFKVWSGKETLNIETSVRSYLFRAVRNGCMNVLKHREIRSAFQVYHENSVQESHRSQEEELMGTELEQKIREAIDKLPAERRKVFLYSRYDGLSYLQIAGKLGISVKTVENQMGMALKSLRRELKDYLPILLFLFMDL